MKELVFTGKLPVDKDECVKLAAKQGYNVTNTVHEGSTLIVSNVNNTWKQRRAEKLGVTQVPFKQWYSDITL